MRPSLDHADSNAKMAEEGLERALQAVHSNEFEAAKFRDPFRRRFTAAWCYAEAQALGNWSDLEGLLYHDRPCIMPCCIRRQWVWSSEV